MFLFYGNYGKHNNYKVALCLTKHHAMKAYGEVEVSTPCILNLSSKWK